MPNSLTANKIESRIFTIRGLQVMLDRDLAELYQVPVKALNQAVKRNINRFPERFRFQLNKMETVELVTNCDRFKSLKHSSVLPYVFAESGVAMLSTVLRSTIAVSVSVKIMDAFVAMRKILSAHTSIIQRLETVEQKQIETDKKVDKIFNALESKEFQPEPRQVFNHRRQGSLSFGSKFKRFRQEMVCFLKNGNGRAGSAGEDRSMKFGEKYFLH